MWSKSVLCKPCSQLSARSGKKGGSTCLCPPVCCDVTSCVLTLQLAFHVRHSRAISSWYVVHLSSLRYLPLWCCAGKLWHVLSTQSVTWHVWTTHVGLITVPLGGTACVHVGQNLVCAAVHGHQLHCIGSCCAMQIRVVQWFTNLRIAEMSAVGITH